MGFRIGKIFGQPLGTQSVNRKAGDRPESGSRQGSGDQQNSERNKDETATIEEVTVAVASESAELLAAGQDLRVEMTQSSAGPRVRITDIAGQLIREMSGEEFLKLRKKSHGDFRVRGRLLDQKL